MYTFPLSLRKKHISDLIVVVGCGFATKQRYRFGWFSMRLKLVGGDSAGVVTAYYVRDREIYNFIYIYIIGHV